MIPESSILPLEDELGDVLEKAMSGAGMDAGTLSAKTGVPASRIRDAIDYRPELTSVELCRLSAALGLNEVGLCALGGGQYPLPAIGGLPFELRPMRMRHGIGVANAYLVSEFGSASGLLFDTGAGLWSLAEDWPDSIRGIEAVFLTHVETEHAGGLCEVVARFGVSAAYVPLGAHAPCGSPLGEGETKTFGSLNVQVFSTPGHSEAHNCYLVNDALLVSGDLIFAGSAGGGYFCHRRLRTNLRRVLGGLAPDTVIAPGHGPLTTVGNELRFNPFLG